MSETKVFIAYHGTYDKNGSYAKAQEISRYLTDNGITCYLFNGESAFADTPENAGNCDKFLLVCNEHIVVNDEGAIDTTHSNGIYQELRLFTRRIYHNEVSDGDARVYGFGQFTSTMGSKLSRYLTGVAHFTEIRNGGQPCYDQVLEWARNKDTKDVEKSTEESDAIEDIRLVSIRISKKSEYGLSPVIYTEELLPKLVFDGGKSLRNILELEPEKNRKYVIYANGGSGKSYSLKSLWFKNLNAHWLPLYISVRTCYEKYGEFEHPLYEYLKAVYRHFPCEPDNMPDYLSKVDADWLLLIDGYNEAESIEKIREDLNEIEDHVTMVITTRDKSFLKGLDANNMLYLTMLPLEESTVKNYIAGYNDGQLMPLLSDANMLVMLRNPMLLTMFCNSFDSNSYDFHLEISQSLLTPGELIEKCVIAQLKKTDSVHIGTFFTILCLFPMAIADMYYRNNLVNMITSRIDLTRELNTLLTQFDIDNLEAYYLLEYADKWDVELTDDEMQELLSFLRERKPLAIRNELASFERIMSRVLQFFTVDAERSRVGGGIYCFDHQTSLNWYIAYGIYVMAELWPERFSEILAVITENVDITSENTDDYEEQSEFIFDLIRDYDGDEMYRHFANKLFTRHFAIKTSRLYDIATGCISLYDRSRVSDEEYANDVSSFCYSLFSLNERTPASMDENQIIETYGRKLDEVIKRAERIKDDEYRAVTISKINTIQGALCLGKYRLYNKSHKEKTPEVKQHLYDLALEAQKYQISALRTREEVIASGSGKYSDEMRNRIAHSYTSLGTISFYLGDYEKSIEYHTLAYNARKEIADDELVDSELRDDARLRLSINLNRINGSLLRRGDLTKEEMIEIFNREIMLADTNKIEPEMINQVGNLSREIRLLGNDKDLINKAKEAYEHINDAFNRMFGYQSDKLKTVEEQIRFLENKYFRIISAKEYISEFINSEPFQKIVMIFNEGKPIHDINELNKFADNWDYRRKLAAGGERQQIVNEDEFVMQYRDEFICCFRKLGMLDEKTDISYEPDYILPLGGFGSSNMRRCLLAKKTADRYPDREIKIVALSSHRSIVQESEFESKKDFAPDASTEFEQMDMAMRKAFDLKSVASAESYNEPDTREFWTMMKYESANPLRSYYDLSAPCYDENRARANTIDTFRHFLKCFEVSKGSMVFLLSTALYEPYQLYSLLPDAIEYGVELFFVGGSYKNSDDEILATLCLQDLKSAVNAMCRFEDLYKEVI
ncbi:MAG: hypothetical protein IJM15_03240 [Erysipelotrichaceae bacterium]|nr:hypothetical protein [Erysipelotrichaceae bacterium]